MAGEGVLGLPHQVEVGQARLHHQHVRPLGHVPSSCTLGEASGAAGKLVLFTVAKGRCGLCCLPERSVEAGGELDGVAEDGNSVAVAIVGKDLFMIMDQNVNVVEKFGGNLSTCLMARIVNLVEKFWWNLLDGKNPPVHHVGGGNDVCASLGKMVLDSMITD